MTFLHPALLALAVLAVVPIGLHLLTRQRAFKSVELSTFRFLFDTYQQQRRRLRFQDVLLALLRAGAILLLVLGVARPVVQNWNNLFPQGSRRDVFLLMDCSASMNAQSSGVSALQRARKTAQTLVSQLAPDDQVTLVRLTDKAEEVCRRLSPGSAEVRDGIEGLQGSSARGNVLATLQQVIGSRAANGLPPLIALLTDAQASGWREVEEAGRREVLLPEGSRLMVVNVAPPETQPNVAVVGHPPAGRRTVVGLPMILSAHVVNHAATNADVVVTLVVDEKETARTSLVLQPQEQTTVPMMYVPDAPGVKRGRFEISTRSGNVFPDDDRYLFTVTAAPRVRVLLVNGWATPDPRDAETVYLRSALASASEDGPASGELRPDTLEVEEVLEPAVRAETLHNADVVILANCGALTPIQYQTVRDFVAGGGGLLIFPGDRVTAEGYNRDFFTDSSGARGRLIAAELGSQEGDPEKPETFERLAAVDLDHPALTVFADPENRLLRSVRYYRRWELKLADATGPTRSLARFASGRPALVEAAFGQGRVVLAAFPAHVRWTNWPLKPEFVPLILRLTEHVLRRPDVEGPSVVPPATRAEISTVFALADALVQATDPAGRSLSLPEFQRSSTRLVAGFGPLQDRGYYTLSVQGAAGRGAIVEWAVNLDPRESDFTPMTKDALQKLLPGTTVEVIDASEKAQQVKGSLDERTETWSWLILGVLLVITVEFLLATGSLNFPGGGTQRYDSLVK